MSGYQYELFIIQIYWCIFMKSISGFIWHHSHYITLAFIYMVLHFRRLMMFWFMQPLWKLMASPMIPVYWSSWPLNTVAWPTSDDNSCQYARGLVWGIYKKVIVVARWHSQEVMTKTWPVWHPAMPTHRPTFMDGLGPGNVSWFVLSCWANRS